MVLPNTATNQVDLEFQGPFEPSRDGLDAVAIFDGTSWRLELIDATLNLRSVLWLASKLSFIVVFQLRTDSLPWPLACQRCRSQPQVRITQPPGVGGFSLSSLLRAV